MPPVAQHGSPFSQLSALSPKRTRLALSEALLGGHCERQLVVSDATESLWARELDVSVRTI